MKNDLSARMNFAREHTLAIFKIFLFRVIRNPPMTLLCLVGARGVELLSLLSFAPAFSTVFFFSALPICSGE